ncbi:MAG: glycosyltransferase family 4 protein [Cytophagaceae bacterium]|nr:glycosyltransferase family 4 protein [Gemmatimonadaceae bacterium]
MRIVQISPYSWDAPGGVNVHVGQLSHHLRERGHDVIVLAPGDAPGFREGARIVGRPYPVHVNGSVARLCFSRRSSRVVRKALEVFTPDVIHVHDPLTPSTAMLGVLHRNAPVVATFHSYFAREHFEGRVYTAIAPFLRPVWRKVDRRLAVSTAARHSVCSRMGNDPVEIVPNGADVDIFASATPATLPPGRRLLFVGRLEPRKGFPVAVRAFAKLAPAYPDLQLVVVGDGEERHAVDDLPPDVRSRVHMMGRVSYEALPTYHKAADIFVSPATGSESFGIVLVEAMAAGLPLVASDIAGYREVARDGREGLLVRPSDHEALAHGVQRLLDSPALAAALGEGGAVRARAFAWDHIIDRLESVYDSLVIKERRPVSVEVARPLTTVVDGAADARVGRAVDERGLREWVGGG